MLRVDKLAIKAQELIEKEKEPQSEMEKWYEGSTPRHHQIARLAALGLKGYEIAPMVDMTSEGVNSVMRSPLFKAVVRELEGKLDEKVVLARKILIEAAPLAAHKKVSLLDSLDPSIVQTASSDILKGTKVIGEDNNGGGGGPQFIIKAEQLQLINQTLNQLKEANND